jgi:predicted N-formylglutamate amidohydrolase
MNDVAAAMENDRPALLGADDPPPFEVINASGRARAILLCDHASWMVPAALAGLGLDESVLRRHIGWDIGAADVARRLAGLLDAPALLAGYSRLVIDCNRPPGVAGSIPAVSDGVAVPGNQDLDGDAARARLDACFTPYHQAVEAIIAEADDPAILSIHSFTPVMDGFERPWHVGVLWHGDDRLSAPLLAALRKNPTIRVGDNEPYSGLVPRPYTIPTHGEAPGRPHVAIEVRQDLIDTHHGAEAWANRLAAALGAVLADPAAFKPLAG